MELTNEFRVNVPVDDAWAVLTDVERIAPAMPGAQLQEIEGDEYRGIVKVKVGPITAQYKGTARFQEQDKVGHKVVLRAEGRDTRGQGNASATVTATLVPDGDGTRVTVVTDLTITGKVAQFGRGVLADVSTKLLGQFVDNLERDVLSGAAHPNGSSAAAATPAAAPAASAAAPSQAAAPTATATARRIEHPEPEPVDLLQTAGQPVAKRVVPLVGGLLAIFLIWRVVARRRKR
jgi:carbon monoxide dehydrogenase subunit G